MRTKIGIVGCGFVGGAVSHVFRDCDLLIVDPAHSDMTIQEAIKRKPDALFVCVPTPSLPCGAVDASIVLDVLGQIPENQLVILKSTLTPDHLELLPPNVVYNPEFLTQANAKSDMLESEFILLGGSSPWTDKAKGVWESSSICNPRYLMTDRSTASLWKYTANSWLATKVIFFNEIKTLCEKSGADYRFLCKNMGLDERIGPSHMNVPGPDGLPGFGGACFPKDTAALLSYAGDGLDVLSAAVEKNRKIRP